MFDANSLFQVLTFLLVSVLGFMLYLFKMGAEAAVKTSAEEAAKATIQQLKWPIELAQELQKTRGVERQENRYKCYGALWGKLRPLAIYDATVIDKKLVSDLSSNLSNWYFSECGGLLLTPQARDFYFALQDLLRATSRLTEDWVAERPENSGDEKHIFQELLKARSADAAIGADAANSAAAAFRAFEFVSTVALEDWQKLAAGFANDWREGINTIAGVWQQLDKRQRFATLQQVGSVLRSSLANDLESRLL